VNAYLLRFAVLGIPAAAVLLWWRRDGVLSKGLYSSSWANVISYGIWLLLGILLNRIGRIPAAPRLFGSLVGFLIASPVIGSFCSLVLLILSLFAEQNEKGKMGSSSVLMALLWASALIAPN
jgi:hypothetical protein